MNIFELYKKHINQLEFGNPREIIWLKTLEEIRFLEIMEKITNCEAEYLINLTNHRYKPTIYSSPDNTAASKPPGKDTIAKSG